MVKLWHSLLGVVYPHWKTMEIQAVKAERVLASAQAISEPACLRGDGLGHTRDLPRGRRLEAR
jgi:hypothetical protein